MEITYCITLLRPMRRLALDDELAPELKAALPSLVLTPEVGGSLKWSWLNWLNHSLPEQSLPAVARR